MRRLLPPAAPVIVISKGDPELARRRRARRVAFPAGRSGQLRRPLPRGKRRGHRSSGGAQGPRRPFPRHPQFGILVARTLQVTWHTISTPIIRGSGRTRIARSMNSTGPDRSRRPEPGARETAEAESDAPAAMPRAGASTAAARGRLAAARNRTSRLSPADCRTSSRRSRGGLPASSPIAGHSRSIGSSPRSCRRAMARQPGELGGGPGPSG